MATDTERRAHELLMEALDLPPDERTALINERCAGDARLEARVRHLIHALEQSDGFLESPAVAPPRQDDPTPAELDARIPGYRPLRLIASGGMAAVYEAEQAHPRRTVALKVMRAHLAGRGGRERFLFETEVLAQLHHPGIAQIYEAGAFDDAAGGSIPFFAMELVRGARTITRFADDERLDLDDRLALFADVCDAVHHGHQLGVIHRDLKPGNILVGDDARPKVIDYGVARPSAPGQAWITSDLDTGRIVGTLNAMAPEQCAPGRTIDTRTDVYALGVVLYELVTGRTPFDLADLPVAAALRTIEQGVRRRPSTWRPAARGDIDAIVMRALETAPDRRYQTVSELAADARRALDHEPVHARPATAMYQFRKFARRHRVPVAATAAVILALAGGLAAASRMAYVADRARDDEAAARARAERQAAIAEGVNRFWLDILGQANPQQAQAPDLTVRQALDRASPRIDASGLNRDVRREVHLAMSDAYHGLSLYLEAAAHAEAAVTLGADEPEAAIRARAALGRALLDADDIDNARHVLDQTDADAIDALGPAHPQRISILRTRARVAERAFNMDRALDLLAQASRLTAEAAPPDDDVAFNIAAQRARILRKLGRQDEAARVLTGPLERRRAAGPLDTDALGALATLAASHYQAGRFEESLPLFAELLDAAPRVFGPDHNFTLTMRANKAGLLREMGRLAEAEALQRELLAYWNDAAGPDDPRTVSVAHSLGASLIDLGRLDEAEQILTGVVERRADIYGPTHVATLNSLSLLTTTYVKMERYGDAAPMVEDLLVQLRDAVPEGHYRLFPALRNHAICLIESGRADEAAPFLLESHDVILAARGPGHPQSLRAAELLADLYERLGDEAQRDAWRTRLQSYQAEAR